MTPDSCASPATSHIRHNVTTQPLVKALKARRKAQKLSRKQVAQSADISPTTVNRLETGANVGLEAACAIATVLGGELRFAPTDTVPVPTAEPLVPKPGVSGAVLELVVDADASKAYHALRARFEDGERFDAMVNALRESIPKDPLHNALVVLAAQPGLPSSKRIRELCQ